MYQPPLTPKILSALKTTHKKKKLALKIHEIIQAVKQHRCDSLMVLDDRELLQIDEKYIARLSRQDPAALTGLSITLLNDLKEARERLNQNPFNSSQPSGSMPPWDKGAPDDGDFDLPEDADEEIAEAELGNDVPMKTDTASDDKKDDGPDATDDTPKRKPGRQPNSQGFGRTQKLAITDTQHHHCDCCSVCKAGLDAVEKPYTGFYSIDVEFGNESMPGVRLTHTHHLYYSAQCPNCGLENRSQPWRAPEDRADWADVGMTEWRLVGPGLAALIAYLTMEMRITRRKVQLFLFDVLGVKLSIGSIQNCMVESARTLAPVENQVVDELLSESMLHADETSHNEAGTRLWLWVFITSATALFLVGQRSKEMFINMLQSSSVQYDGWLMSDGYRVYRDFINRLRCWAHLKRKAKGLCESYTPTSRKDGKQMLDSLDRLIAAVYQAREGPDKGKVSIAAHHQGELERLRELCEAMSASSHKKTRELGREFLNDWEAIFRVLDCPAWPLTNNEAERALRHWVIMRKITQGTRSEQGSRTLALFASIITTCRLRNASPLLYIRDVIHMRRQGKDAPALPVAPALAG